ncbi:hypothetical protein DA2_3077 [Desulfovibrio sp. A2]|nr:hypothetical protein DA2_3077 [Desulfovibrio sp. A2]
MGSAFGMGMGGRKRGSRVLVVADPAFLANRSSPQGQPHGKQNR